MIKSKKLLLISLILPIFILIGLTFIKKNNLEQGLLFTFPIAGFDPRDLLSGHYLVYQIDYGVKNICESTQYGLKRPAYICLDPKEFNYQWPHNCKTYIKGDCIGSRFEAGVERYYVPEREAKNLEALIRQNQASIVLSIPSNGQAQIKDLLINGQSWRSFLKSHPK